MFTENPQSPIQMKNNNLEKNRECHAPLRKKKTYIEKNESNIISSLSFYDQEENTIPGSPLYNVLTNSNFQEHAKCNAPNHALKRKCEIDWIKLIDEDDFEYTYPKDDWSTNGLPETDDQWKEDWNSENIDFTIHKIDMCFYPLIPAFENMESLFY